MTIEDAVDVGVRDVEQRSADDSPPFDPLVVQVIARLGRARTHIETELEPVYRRHGLTAPAFFVLSNLRRRPPDFELTQRQLGERLGLTPGTLSVRVAQLVEAGLVERGSDPNTARGVLVRATPLAISRFDACLPDINDEQERLLSALDTEQRTTLAALLKRLTVDIAPSGDTAREHSSLGLVVEPASVSRADRRRVGLGDRIGVLVVAAASPAADHGVRQGDLIVAVNDTPVRSILDLPADADDVRSWRIVRGDAELAIP